VRPRSLFKPTGELGDGGGLAGTVQADEQDDERRRPAEVERGGRVAEDVDQLAVDELHEVLLGVRLRSTSCPSASFLTASTKSRTTLRLTSASRSASRTSRSASSMFFSVIFPCPWSFRSRESNFSPELNRTCV